MKDTLSKHFVAYKPHDPTTQTRHWNGGRYIDKYGYVLVYHPTHPHRNANGYVKEHRMIIENHIGRYLTKYEEVHHINENKQDNRLENLQFMSRREHRSIQRKGKHIDYSGRMCYECESNTTYIRPPCPPYSATPTPNWYKHPKDRTQWCCRKCWYRLRTKI